jgi:hypothetical protein
MLQQRLQTRLGKALQQGEAHGGSSESLHAIESAPTQPVNRR